MPGYREEEDVRFVVMDLCLLTSPQVREKTMQCSGGTQPVAWALGGKVTVRRSEGLSPGRGRSHVLCDPEDRSKGSGWMFQEN